MLPLLILWALLGSARDHEKENIETLGSLPATRRPGVEWWCQGINPRWGDLEID